MDERPEEIVNTPKQYTANQEFESLNGEQHITSSDDLPAPQNGEIQLEDSTVYKINGTINVDATVVLGNISPLKGTHGGIDILNYTGTGAAIKSDGNPYFTADMSVVAASGTALDLTADDRRICLRSPSVTKCATLWAR